MNGKIEIGNLAIEYYKLRKEAEKLRKERGHFECECGECFRGRYFCYPGKEYGEVSRPFWEKSKRAAAVKRKMIHRIKKYIDYELQNRIPKKVQGIPA